MTKLLIVALVCLNAALFAVLVAGTGVQKAYGQYAGADYIAVTGKAGANDAVYIVDLSRRRLTAWRILRAKNQVAWQKAAGRRELSRDFGAGR